jgi:hypothetical protein
LTCTNLSPAKEPGIERCIGYTKCQS